MDIKTNIESNFSLIERSSSQSVTLLIPANEKWETYNLTYTTPNNPTLLNFFINPRNANATVYIDNIQCYIQ